MTRSPNPWREYAPAIKGEVNEHYRIVESGRGYFSADPTTGFNLAGYMRPADARLIAAAPNLLEAAQAFAACIGDGIHLSDDEREGLEYLRAAIAKAELPEETKQ